MEDKVEDNILIKINKFLKDKDTIFTSKDFCTYMKSVGIKVSRREAEYFLGSYGAVFELWDNNYISRASVFSGKYFSFKPSREEIEKGYFIIGHRCMPFCRNDVSPDSFIILSGDKILESKAVDFSTNLALDSFTLFGDGFVIPYILNDKNNKSVTFNSIECSLPSSFTLTAWPLAELENGYNIEYGDRILCRIVDWQRDIVEMTVIKNQANNLVVTRDDIEREEWYSVFEKGMLDSLNKFGPTSSIEEQLIYLFVENQEKLCVRNCGSTEEFLIHTSKIDFEPYGIESRIWRVGESVPFVGEWNKVDVKNQLIYNLSIIFTPAIIDSYIKNSIYLERKKRHFISNTRLMESIIPDYFLSSNEERNVVLLNIEKRRDILREEYNPFVDYSIAEVRKRILTLFSKVCSILCLIGCSSGKVSDFPQQELVILSQIFGQLVRVLEEIEADMGNNRFFETDFAYTLTGIEETFDGVCGVLKAAAEKINMKGFEIFSDNKKN